MRKRRRAGRRVWHTVPWQGVLPSQTTLQLTLSPIIVLLSELFMLHPSDCIQRPADHDKSQTGASCTGHNGQAGAVPETRWCRLDGSPRFSPTCLSRRSLWGTARGCIGAEGHPTQGDCHAKPRQRGEARHDDARHGDDGAPRVGRQPLRNRDENWNR